MVPRSRNDGRPASETIHKDQVCTSSVGAKVYCNLLEWFVWLWLLYDGLPWIARKIVLATAGKLEQGYLYHYQRQASKLRGVLFAWF